MADTIPLAVAFHEIVHSYFRGTDETKYVMNETHYTVTILLLSGIYSPYKFELLLSGGSEITHKYAPQSVGLLWTRDQPVTESST
jgi:hypothetical protein